MCDALRGAGVLHVRRRLRGHLLSAPAPAVQHETHITRENGATHPPPPRRHVLAEERQHAAPVPRIRRRDAPLEHRAVRADAPAGRGGLIHRAAALARRAAVDDGGEVCRGAEVREVDPARVLRRPGVCVALGARGRAGRVVRGGVREADELEVGAVCEDLGGSCVRGSGLARVLG